VEVAEPDHLPPHTQDFMTLTPHLPLDFGGSSSPASLERDPESLVYFRELGGLASRSERSCGIFSRVGWACFSIREKLWD